MSEYLIFPNPIPRKSDPPGGEAALLQGALDMLIL
jgi:hypothetical protein